MTGILFTRTSFSLSDLDGHWQQVNDYDELLNRLMYDMNIKCMLIDSNLTDKCSELYHLLQYRCKQIGEQFTMSLYEIISEEQMYLKLMKEILSFGNFKTQVRTDVPVHSLFGKTLRFDLQNNTLPLLTTKRVYFKGVAKELLWFLRGSTHTKELQADNIKIWNDNASREFLDKVGLKHYEEGELGPIYGYQWRSWGKEYKSTDKTSSGIDQIQNIINTIKTNPDDRRMILSAWNVSQLQSMALPPCHILAQFYVHEKDNVKYLSCSMYQRSADLFLGVPFNIASYAMLTHMIAHVTGCTPYELIMNFGDTHLYGNHIEQAKKQLERMNQVVAFPKLYIDSSKKNIDDIKYEDFLLENYESQGSIPAPMAV